MEPATQEGAETSEKSIDVTSAAKSISGLLDAQATQEPEPNKDEPTQAPEQAPSDQKAEPQEPDGESGTAQEEKEEVQLESLEELSQATELELDKILNLKTKVKVDGKESYIPLSEALKSYQLSSHVNNQSQELANKRKAFEEQSAAKSKEIEDSLQVAQGLVQKIETQLLNEFNGVDWDGLRKEDSHQYMLRRQEFADRAASIEAMKREVSSNVEKQKQELIGKQTKALTELRAEETRRLIDAIDEWKDEKKFSAGKEQIVNYLKGLGFDNEQIGSVLDHRVIVMARKAMLYDHGKQNVDAKKVVPVKKVLTSKGVKTSPSDEKVTQLRQQLKKTGRVEDAAALILERIGKQ